jgi:hypothetical protein
MSEPFEGSLNNFEPDKQLKREERRQRSISDFVRLVEHQSVSTKQFGLLKSLRTLRPPSRSTVRA